MAFDLRSRYAFNSTEGQIPEGSASVYGVANSHANCVPASFTAALNLLGLGDIDPQLVTNELYGPNFRGGFGNFAAMIGWIRSHVSSAPAISDGPFDFAAAEAAGQAGKLIVVAGWIRASTVTFVPESQALGFSHASLLAAHLPDDTFVIWNTWTGQMQSYSRAVIGAAMYEMAVLTPANFSGGSASLQGDSLDPNNPNDKAVIDGVRLLVEELGVPYVPGGEAAQTQSKLDGILAAVQKLPGTSAPADFSAVLAAAQAAQKASENAAQALLSASSVIATAAADIKAIRAKTDKDLS